MRFCGCAHAESLHDGPCQVSLPAFLEEELPAWRCPCPGFLEQRRGPWRWRASTGSWAADCSPLNTRRGARVAGEATTGVNLPDTRAG